jgi:hypothetical protein
MKLFELLKTKITASKSAQTDDAWRQETAAMVYGGDIYAVLLHDRFVRQLAFARVRRTPSHTDNVWPLIR